MKFLLVVYLILFQFIAGTAFAVFGSRRQGLEFEFAGAGAAADNSQPEGFRLMLQMVREQFGGTEIVITPWTKWSDLRGAIQASMQDAQGRTWLVVPEIMNTGAFDGYELVTPPLDSAEDGVKLQATLDRVESSRQFAKGWSSSTHVTFDISNLVQGSNVAKVVDLILFLESHMPEIYKAVNPQRYNQSMNLYAVPLGLDQKSLLQQLAALSHSERTYENVREIFLRHESFETSLVGDIDMAWKYRSVNYGKFFALGSFAKAVPVLEFRISDLAGSKNVLQLSKFYSALIDVGSNTRTSEYKDPFASLSTRPSNRYARLALDKAMTVSAAAFADFLNLLKLSPSQVPAEYSGYALNSCSAVLR